MGVSKICRLPCINLISSGGSSPGDYLEDGGGEIGGKMSIKPYFDLTSSVQWKLLRIGELFGVSPFTTSDKGISFKWASRQTAYFLFVLAISTCWLGYFLQMLVYELIQ